MNGFAFRIVSSKYWIGSCTLEEIPNNYKEQFEKTGKDIKQMVAYYFKERDCIVMNEEHPFYEGYKELALAYMETSEENRNYALECADDDAIFRFLIFLEGIIRHRENRKAGVEHESN